MRRAWFLGAATFIVSGCSGTSGTGDGAFGNDAAVNETPDASSEPPDASTAHAACSVPDDYPCILMNGGNGACCRKSCLDVESDPSNCGFCGHRCPSPQQCVSGVCVVGNSGCPGLPDFTLCAPPADGGFGSCCSGACNGGTDSANCGSCGVVCPTGAICSQGQCSSACQPGTCPGALTCTQSELGEVCLSSDCAGKVDGEYCSISATIAGSCCGGLCVDRNSDSSNCGSCGWICDPGSFCWGGACQASQDCATAHPGALCQQPDGGTGFCCGTCGPLDLQTDPLNCGGCGFACATGTVCVGGSCASNDGGFSSCYSGLACPWGYACTQGTCLRASCSAGTAMEPCASASLGAGACCGTSCVDLSQDNTNCGACGNTCQPGTFCNGAVCQTVPTCTLANSGVDCPMPSGVIGKCCSGQCIDIRSDPSNCAGCGMACPAGEVCNTSISPSCSQADGGSGAGCWDNPASCAAGSVCSYGYCLSSCAPGASGGACAFGNALGHCCNGICVDYSQDPVNCGACGTECPSGICYSSFSGMPGQCLPGADAGGCGFGGCPPGMTCVAGNCISSSGCQGPMGLCAAGTGNAGVCCPNFFGATCADLTSDRSNCGNCGIACPGNQTCVQGACSGDAPPCGLGRNGAYCELDGGTSFICCPGGGCADLRTDATNCGYCGNACNFGLTCVGGRCLALTCSASLTGQDCAGADGGLGVCCGSSCMDEANDPKNCGGCGHTCVGSETCRGGDCGFDLCTSALQGDPCHLALNGYLYVGTCCGASCVDTTNDPTNCGGCNLACTSDGGCSGSVCH